MTELLLKTEAYRIVGAAIEVHRILGRGFLEAIYQEAFEAELLARNVPFRPKPKLRIQYKERLLETFYIPDLVCFETVVVELKALSTLTSADTAQLLNYLKASHLRVGLLVNFGVSGRLQWKRLVL